LALLASASVGVARRQGSRQIVPTGLLHRRVASERNLTESGSLHLSRM
jgi:hypothetical protein